MEIALSEARQMDLALPGLALANQLYLALRAQGGGAKGTEALVLALAKLSDVPWDQAQAAGSPGLAPRADRAFAGRDAALATRRGPRDRRTTASNAG